MELVNDLKAAVLAYVDECAIDEVPPGPYPPEPVFARHVAADGTVTVTHISGRPGITAVSLELLDAASPDDALGWDGDCLTMPGGLRYRPVGLSADGWSVVCRKVGP